MTRLFRTGRSILLRTLTLVSLVLFVVVSIISILSLNQKVAQAAANNTINFQARLLSISGAVVPDTTYSIQFKIYSASSGGTAEWTETDSSVSTTNGYLTISLGATNAFSNATTPINWDQQQWLTMNVNSDGEMNPRMPVTAVPYALSAGQLQTSASANGVTSTLSIVTPTSSANQTFLVPNEGGTGGTYTLCVRGANGCPVSGGLSGGQTLIGGTGTTDSLTLQSTSGTAASGANILFKTGSSGGTTAMTILYNGNVEINAFSTAGVITNSAAGVLQSSVTLGNTLGGTGQNSSSWTGLVYVNAGTWTTATAGTNYVAGGTGSANQLAYFTGSGAISGSANMTNSGALLYLDTNATGTVNLGTTNATTIGIGNSTAATAVGITGGGTGGITLTTTGAIGLNSATINSTASSLTLFGSPTTVTAFGAATSVTEDNVATTLNIDNGGAAATIGIGNASATALNLAAITTTVTGTTINLNAASVTGSAAATWSTSAGALTVQGFGGLNLYTPAIATGPSTNVQIATGNVTTSGTSGTLSLATGTSVSGATGPITIQTGTATSGTSGNITIDNGSSSTGTPVLNLGNTNARTITIGNSTAATAVGITGGGTGGITLTTTGAIGLNSATINSTASSLTLFGSPTTVTAFGAATSVTEDNVATTLNIDNGGAAATIGIGNASATALNLAAITSTVTSTTLNLNDTTVKVSSLTAGGLVMASGTGALSIATAGTNYVAGGTGSANQLAYFTGSGAIAGSTNYTYTNSNATLYLNSSNSSGTTTTSALSVSANSLTTGTALYVASSTLTSGDMVDLEVSGTAAAVGTQSALNILTTGANGTAGVTTYGAYISNTHSTNTSINVALYLNASGGATGNYALVIPSGGGNVGIGTTTPTNILSFGGQSNQTIWMERNTTGNTSGNSLTVEAGGATSGANNKNGGSLYLAAGISTGSGSSNIYLQTAPQTGPITSVTLGSGGSGYVSGDVGATVTIAGGTSGTATIASVGGGAVTGVTLLAGGSGYSNNNQYNLPATGGTGTGLTVNIGVGGTNDNSLVTAMTITNKGYVGIGTTTPADALDIFSSGNTPNGSLQLTNENSSNGANIIGLRALWNGTSPQAVTSGTQLTALFGAGYNGSSFNGNSVSIRFYAAENYTAANNGSYMDFSTTLNGTTSRSVRMTLQNTGDLDIGTNTDVSGAIINAVGTVRASSFYSVGIAPPTGLAVSPQGGTGSTTWGYEVTALTLSGETVGTSEIQIPNGYASLNGTYYNQITWNASAGAVSYNIYRTTAGGTPNTTGLIGSTSALTFNDTGLTSGVSVPTTGFSSSIYSGSGLGVGTLQAAGDIIDVNGTFDGKTDGEHGIYSTLNVANNTANQTSNTAYGATIRALYSGTYNFGTIEGERIYAGIGGTAGTVTAGYGLDSFIWLTSTGSAQSFTTAAAIVANGPTKGGATNTETVGTEYGLLVNNQGGTTAGIVTGSSYAIDIAAQSGCAGTCWSIYSSGGMNYLNGNLGVGVTPTSTGAFLQVAASTTSQASINLASGVNHTSSLVSGDLWWNGTNLDFYNGTTTEDLLTGGGGMANPMTTTGDIIYSSSGSTPARLAIVATGSILVSGATPSWSTTPAITTSLTVPTIYGGAAVGSTLTLQGTTGNGTSSVAAIQMKVGNAGVTTAVNILNSGMVGINTTAANTTSALTVTGTSSVATVDTTNQMIASGTFASATNWTPTTGWTITTGSPGYVTHAATNLGTLSATTNACSGSVYQVNFTLSYTTSGGGLDVSLGGTDSGTDGMINGSQTVYITPGSCTGTLVFTPVSGTWAGTITNITIYVINSSTPDVSVVNSNGSGSPLEVRAGGSGTYNTFVGRVAGLNDTTGQNNVGIGAQALQYNTTGGQNVALGESALYLNNTGAENTAVGTYALQGNQTGGNNSAFGLGALSGNTSGSNNVAVGEDALQYATTANVNVAVGMNALLNITSSGNTALGSGAGQYISGGSVVNQTSYQSVYIGYGAEALANGDYNEIVIGAAGTSGNNPTVGAGNNSVTLGNNATTTIQLGNSQPSAGGNAVGTNITVNGSGGYGTGAGGKLTLQAGAGGSTGAGGETDLYGGNAGGGDTTGGNVVISPGNLAGSGTAGSVIIKPQNSANNNNTFQVQNGVGNPILLVSTTTPNNLLAYPGFEVGTVGSLPTGWTNVSPGTNVINATQPHIYNGLYSDNLTTSTTAGAGLSSSSFTTTTITSGVSYVLSFYVKPMSAMNASAFTITVNDGTAHTCSPASQTLSTSGFMRVYCSITTSSTSLSSVSITQNDTTARTIYIDAVQLEKGTTPTAYQIGTIQLRGTISNPIALESSSNSTTAFQIQDSTGISNLFVADTLNGAVYVNGYATIGGASTSGTITLGSSTAANTILIGNGTGATTVNIANAETGGAVNIGAAMTTGTITIGGGGIATTGTITLGSSTATNSILIGNGASGATTIAIGNVSSAAVVDIGNAMVAGTITIGGTAQTGTIGLGTGTGAQTINLGSGGTGIKTINLGGSAANVITVGNGQTAGSITIGGSLTTGTIFLGASATTTAETGIIDIGYGDGVDTINIGSYTTGAKTITLGSTAASSTTTINGATTSLTGATIKMTTLTAGTGYWLCDSSGTILEDNGTACTSSSSETMKHNIQTMGDVLPDLSALNPVTFDWNSGYQASNGGSYDMGFIAEQVQSIFPELVSTDSSGQVTGLNYLGLIPIAIKAAQEEEQQITTEQSDIALIQSSIQNGVLNVNGANIQGNTNIGGSLNVSGPTSLSDLTVSGTATTQELVVNDKATINNLQITGSAEFDGNINLAATVNTEQAITKQFIASGPIAAGSVVILDPTQNGYVTTTTDFEDTRIIGVAVDTANNAGDVIKVAIGGSVQVQADPFTAVASGDIMVSDVNAGKATADTNPKIGSILGKATSAPDANNLVWVLITLE